MTKPIKIIDKRKIGVDTYYFAVTVADLLLGLGKRGVGIEEQVEVLRQIADDLEQEWEEQNKATK